MTVRPTFRALMLLAVGAVFVWLAFQAHQPALVAIAGLVIGAMIAGLVIVLWPVHARDVQWHDPGVGVEGDLTAVTLDMGRDGQVRIESNAQLLGDRWITLDRGTCTVVLDEPNRGIITLGPIVWRRRDPLGMWSARTKLRSTMQVCIGPRRVEVDGVDLVKIGYETELARAGLGDVPDIIPREYRQGDPIRRILWKQSAKHGSFMVRQDAPHGAPTMHLVVDTMLDDDGLDEIARVFASLCALTAASERELDVAETGKPQLHGLDTSSERAVAMACARLNTADAAGTKGVRNAALLITTEPESHTRDMIAKLPAGSLVWATDTALPVPQGVTIAALPTHYARGSRFEQ